MKILIDNGHGAKDYTSGKFSPIITDIKDETIYKDRFREGNFNRLVAKDIVEQLKKLGYDAELIVTEESDISLGERVRRVNKACSKYGAGNVLFISIHANALGYGNEWHDANYWTVWTTKGTTKSDKFADYVFKACKAEMPNMKFQTLMSDGDVDYESNFYVIYHTKCPSILTENFFYTNKDNLKFLTTLEGRHKIATGHVKGIVEYILKECKK